MRGAVAGGHPLTAQAGARVLEEGGNAVDACVAAGFASAITESPLTGPGAGGFMLVHRARDASTRLVDFFVAAPGLGLPPHEDGQMAEVDLGFGEGSVKQIFRIGPASCAVPGAVAGLEAAHRAYGRLPWRELLAPAVELARNGVELTRTQAHMHAILDPILRFGDEGRRVYGRDGARLVAGDLLRLPELADTLEAIGRRGAVVLYTGERARAIVRTVRDGGGAVTLDDLRGYRPVWRRPVRVGFRGHEVVSNPPPSSGGVLIAYGLALLERLDDAPFGSAAAISALVETMREQQRVRGDGFVRGLHRGGLAGRLLSEPGLAAAAGRVRAGTERAEAVPTLASVGGTTHVSVIDADGNAASLSTSTGSGSGVIVPGTGVYMNNMLGEYDLATARPVPAGRRLSSMMAPTIALDDRGAARLVVGSAGSARLRGAILQVLVNVLEHGMPVHDAIGAPRVHFDDQHVHCEGGHDRDQLDRLEADGYDLVRWRRRNLFFGGTAGVETLADGSLAAAGDPRRGGAGVVVER
jgi:gamma-glutamyltranspeptidase/glutathione hydrolase